MKQQIDLRTWERKDHFEFFSRFEEPFFGITAEINCDHGYKISKEAGYSFFLYYLHKVLMAVNQTDAFRYRIENGQVWRYDVIHASPTIDRPDGTFGFSMMHFHDDFIQFHQHGRDVMERVRQSSGLDPDVAGQDVIHFSAIPWFAFTGLSHARSYRIQDSVPKISVGKIFPKSGMLHMPVSVHGHHGLMDGYHVGQFLSTFEKLLHTEPH